MGFAETLHHKVSDLAANASTVRDRKHASQ